ncbi:unnamed protein product [Caenorhabditis angaria]|uniref:G-protein coupled receptors family 1 profile domain-containing protein n=1 Tax=Caenorhabditis angaria TaxID=860376 RepID=A0A9P1NCC4_9PELO|nr:unnamed protein product [Caenorhabditis angaria]
MNVSSEPGYEPSYDITPIRTTANILWSLTAIIGIPANIFVLAAIVYFRDMRTISNIYIFNLAVADLLFLLGVPIVVFSQSANGDWTLGVTMCKSFISGNAVSQFASAVFIAILSFDRFLAVCRPLTSSSLRTPQAAIALSITAWAMVIFETIPLMVFVDVVKINLGHHVKKTCILYLGEQKYLDLSNDSDDEIETVEQNMMMSRRFFISYTFALTATRKKTTKVTIMGLAIVISYTHCLLPFWLVQWFIELNLFSGNPFALVSVSHFAYALQYINSAANPFLYVFLSDSFKKNISKLMNSTRSEKSVTNNLAEQTDSTKLLITRSKESSFVSAQQPPVL